MAGLHHKIREERLNLTEAFLNKLDKKCPTISDQLRLRKTKSARLVSSPYRCCLHFDFTIENLEAYAEFDRQQDGHASKVLEGDRASFMQYFGLTEADMLPLDNLSQT